MALHRNPVRNAVRWFLTIAAIIPFCIEWIIRWPLGKEDTWENDFFVERFIHWIDQSLFD